MTKLSTNSSLKIRYSTEPRYRKYVKEYSFLSYARTFGDKKLILQQKQEQMMQKLLLKEQYKKLQKLQEI